MGACVGCRSSSRKSSIISSIISSKPASTIVGGEDGVVFPRGKVDGATGLVSDLYKLGFRLATWAGVLLGSVIVNTEGFFEGTRLFVIVGTDDG